MGVGYDLVERETRSRNEKVSPIVEKRCEGELKGPRTAACNDDIL
jgi:hypothetical protein